MRIRWRNFELPSKVQPDRESLTGQYGRFVVEPFERGFGNTIGNGLRRALLSSIEGTAVTSVFVEGSEHEFDSLEGVYEDVTDIIMNLKRLRIRMPGDGEITCRILKSGKGPVTGADVQCEGDATVINKDLHIANLTLDRELNIEMQVKKGRGYVPAEENRVEGASIGTIAVDSVYSPVHRVRFAVEATRVGKFTNYDRLVMEIWTDGTVSPEMALTEAAKIYRKHLNPFVMFEPELGESSIPDDPSNSDLHHKNREVDELNKRMDLSLDELELSVRARNCLDGAEITSVRQLVTMPEAEVIKLKNLGRTSLTEIKNKLAELGLELGMEDDDE
ncbi:DNA-directed RNA polymerase subunit alpha [Planctomycetes bacterium Pla163]|uniref:DNA-directed RNA polymerase subunit alpha n=1 Tax=Rohdeia mirabilis TaxID=2528008 RepID=A0A518D2R7_9BACT|nr:DNA-directed RNA polymerase subunit alpha [Planctomycetes bacterium Pla163]